MLRQALDTPWKINNEILRRICSPWVRVLFSFYRIPWGRGWRFYGIPIIQKHRQSQMQFGKDLNLRSSVQSNPLGPNHPVILCTWKKEACLRIGDSFAMTGGAICCAERITIGHHVTIGANTVLADTDFHPLTPSGRQNDASAGKTAPIAIEANVFIGMGCLILKGVTIGEGSVIGAGSVVTKNIPSHCIAAGNPAKVIRWLDPEEFEP